MGPRWGVTNRQRPRLTPCSGAPGLAEFETWEGCPSPATTPLGVLCRIWLGRSFRNKSSNDMALPHPQSRKDHDRKKDKPGTEGVVWKFFKRTVNVTEYRNAKDDVNPAKNRCVSGSFVFMGILRCLRSFDSRLLSRLEAASWALQHRTAWRTRRSAAASRRTSWRRHRPCGRWEFR